MMVETDTSAILVIEGVGFLTVSRCEDVQDPEGRDVYAWALLTPDAKQRATSRDSGQEGAVIRSGVQGCEPREALSSLLSFLGADAERYARVMGPITDPQDDPYLFGEVVAEWAYGVADELAMAQCELDDDQDGE